MSLPRNTALSLAPKHRLVLAPKHCLALAAGLGPSLRARRGGGGRPAAGTVREPSPSLPFAFSPPFLDLSLHFSLPLLGPATAPPPHCPPPLPPPPAGPAPPRAPTGTKTPSRRLRCAPRPFLARFTPVSRPFLDRTPPPHCATTARDKPPAPGSLRNAQVIEPSSPDQHPTVLSGR